MPGVISIGPCDIGADIFVHPVVAQVDLFIGFLCRIGNGLVDRCAVLHGDGVVLVRQRNAGSTALHCRNGGCCIICIQRIRAGGGDLIPAGDGGAVLIHRAVQDKGIGRVLGRDGHRAAVKVDLTGFGDVQIDTGGVGVDGAAVVLAALLVSEGGLLKQQLVAGGGEPGVLAAFRQQGDGVGFHCLLQRRVGRLVVSGHSSSSSSSSLLIDLLVGVEASRSHITSFHGVSKQIPIKLLHGCVSTMPAAHHVGIGNNGQGTPFFSGCTGLLIHNHIPLLSVYCSIGNRCVVYFAIWANCGCVAGL